MLENRNSNQEKVLDDLKGHIPSTTTNTLARDGLEFELS